MSQQEDKRLDQMSGIFRGLGGQPAPYKTISQEFLEIIDSKNSWGKVELKEELLKILARRI